SDRSGAGTGSGESAIAVWGAVAAANRPDVQSTPGTGRPRASARADRSDMGNGHRVAESRGAGGREDQAGRRSAGASAAGRRRGSATAGAPGHAGPTDSDVIGGVRASDEGSAASAGVAATAVGAGVVSSGDLSGAVERITDRWHGQVASHPLAGRR